MSKKFFLSLILFIIILSILFLLLNFFWPRTKKSYALQVTSSPSAQIFLDGQLVGTTPYQNNNLGRNQTVVKLATASAFWSGQVKLVGGTWTIINRELSDNPLFAAGEILTLEKGQGLYLLSTPDQADVEVDDQKVGQTPLLISDISPGEHKIVFFKENYLARSIQAKVHKSYKLVVNVQLSLKPEALSQLLNPLYSTPSARLSQTSIRVLPTSTGWLRVRGQPTLAGKEIGRINQGEQALLLQEEKDWFKVRTNDGIEGWVSAQYVEKL